LKPLTMSHRVACQSLVSLVGTAMLIEVPSELKSSVTAAAESLHKWKLVSRRKEDRDIPQYEDAYLETVAEVNVWRYLVAHRFNAHWMGFGSTNTGAYDIIVATYDEPMKLDVKLSKRSVYAGTTSIMNSEHAAIFGSYDSLSNPTPPTDPNVIHVRVVLDECSGASALTLSQVFYARQQSWIDSKRDTISKFISLKDIIPL
jgi:hypothetical protein